MKKILLILSSLSVFLFANQVELSICGITDDANGSVTFDVCYASDLDLAGVQFDLLADEEFSSGDADFTLTAVYGGAGGIDGVNWEQQVAGNTVLAFKLFGAAVPSTNMATDLLFKVDASYTGSGGTDVDFFDAAASGTDTGNPPALTTNSEFWDAGVLDAALPVSYNLSTAYPNPFNPTTTIDYNVEIAGNVSIVVYDLMGREVKTLVNEFKAPSNDGYSIMWDGTNNQGNLVSTGMYLYRMISNDFNKTYRLTFMK